MFEQNTNEPILLHISKDTFVQLPSLKNNEELIKTVQKTFHHSLTLLPFKYAKLTFDLYNRMTQLVSFKTLKSNLNQYKVAGVYCVESTSTGFIYVGETSNLLNRFKVLPNELKNEMKQNHTSKFVQDWNKFGPEDFVFRIMHIGSEWVNREVRLERERQLVRENASNTYNNINFYPLTPYQNVVLPSLEIVDEALFFPNLNDENLYIKEKEQAYANYKQPGVYAILKPSLGYSRISSPIIIKGNYYESINKAAIGEGTYPKFIRKRLRENHPDYILLNNDDISDMPSKFQTLPFVLYLVENRVYLTQAHANLFEEGGNYSASTLSERFKFQNLESWSVISRREFCNRFEQENWEIMWQWPNDQ